MATSLLGERAALPSLLTLLSAAMVACGNGSGAEAESQHLSSEAQLLVFRGIVGNPPRFDLLTVNADGSDLRPLVGDSVGGSRVRPALFAQPSWSPGGARIAFDAGVDERGFKRDIYTVRANGSDLTRLTKDQASFDPVWSPNGDSLLFARWLGGEIPRAAAPRGSNLWLMDKDGSNPQPLTREVRGVYDRPGSFSPDGTTVAFTRTADPFSSPNHGEVYTLRLDGSHLRKLAENGLDPAYAPDGQTIAFVSNRDQNGELCYGDRCFFAGELYLMNADGSDQERLTETADLHELDPDWSSDGERIAYQRGEATGNAEATGVFAVNPDGSCASAIVLDPSLDIWYSAPAWRPSEKGPGSLRC